MSAQSPTATTTCNLVYGAGQSNVHSMLREDGPELPDADMDRGEGSSTGGEKRESMYVSIFNGEWLAISVIWSIPNTTTSPEVLATVLEGESHLIAMNEWYCLQRYIDLSRESLPELVLVKDVRFDKSSAEARFLLIKLCLRKENKWHRLDDLKYQSEIGSKDKIIEAIRELCHGSHPATQPEELAPRGEQREVIDLTLDEDDEDGKPAIEPPVPQPTPSETQYSSQDSTADPDPILFAMDESSMTIRQLVECLPLDELKKMAKELKLKATGTVRSLIPSLLKATRLTRHHLLTQKASIVTTIVNSSATQGTLNFPAAPKPQRTQKTPAMKQTHVRFGANKPRKTQQERLREIILKIVGSCPSFFFFF